MTDAQHNVTAMVAENGQVVERYAYDPYGRVLVLNGENDPDGAEYTPDADGLSDVGNVILYAGYRFDAASGLYQVRHRYHHPTLGRWINRDPKGYVDGMSLYQYVASRPMAATDPMGTDMIMPEAPSSSTGGDMGDLSVLDSDGKKTPASEMELKADPTGPILEGVDTALLEIGIYVEAPKENGFDLRSLLAMADPADYIPASGDKGWLVEDRLSTGPFAEAGKWAHLDIGPGRPMTFAGPSEGTKFVAGLLGWVASGTWTNINQFNAIRRDSDKIVGELNRQVEAHSEVKVNYVTWGLSDALGLTNSQAFVDVAKGDTAFTMACADLSKACVTVAAVKVAAPGIAEAGSAAAGKVAQVAVTYGPAALAAGRAAATRVAGAGQAAYARMANLAQAAYSHGAGVTRSIMQNVGPSQWNRFQSVSKGLFRGSGHVTHAASSYRTFQVVYPYAVPVRDAAMNILQSRYVLQGYMGSVGFMQSFDPSPMSIYSAAPVHQVGGWLIGTIYQVANGESEE